MHALYHCRWLTSFLILISVSLYQGCRSNLPVAGDAAPAITPIRNARDMMDARASTFVTHPTFGDFSICHGNTCRFIASVGLGQAEWGRIRELFGTAAASRRRNASSPAPPWPCWKKLPATGSGLLQTGEKISTDWGCRGRWTAWMSPPIPPCISTLLQVDHLLKWHTVETRTSRGLGTLQVPHFTAVIRDQSDNMRYAVDSWFLDNGHPPFIVPLSVWERGWRPPSAEVTGAVER